MGSTYIIINCNINDMKILTEQDLFNVPVPKATASYSPVSHYNIVNNIQQQLDVRSVVVKNKDYRYNNKGTQIIGYLDVESGNSTLGMRIAFRNSYDKSMSLAIVAGASVWICSNGMVGGEIQTVRKHTGKITTEVGNKIIDTINQLEDHFITMENHMEKMKSIELNPRATAELIGRMYLEEDVISASQLSIIKHEIEKPSHVEFIEPTLWSAYNHVTESLKTSHPYSYMQNHVKLHDFVETEFSL